MKKKGLIMLETGHVTLFEIPEAILNIKGSEKSSSKETHLSAWLFYSN
jgi:hypothetical protein